ncbi:Retrotransposable element Tf2 [Cucumis melo var. makuwa]|uniref:Retrotransposable element Tf2 n=1 Tax=Cucumis melo var. makuwa TaxID=1194695 RepID=A0A5D3BB23_CUCMM|nr:Retrotransposable element Tf2 [Cucumis melo var. makuwa]
MESWPFFNQELPSRRSIEHHILSKKGIDLVNVHSYRYAYQQKEELEKLMDEVLTSGVIRPSTSLYSSLALLVKKKDGSRRFCVDYRALNNVTIPDKFPIPIIEELFDELKGASMFLKIDLKAGYDQIRMHLGDMEKTSFRTHEGHYKWFVQNYGNMAAPLTHLLKEGAYQWTKKTQEAFEKLKNAMMTLRVLALPHFNLPFKIETEAFGYGIGVVLVQSKRLIAYVETILVRKEVCVVYKPGLENKVVDALSRMPPTMHLNHFSAPALLDLTMIKEEVENDPTYERLMGELYWEGTSGGSLSENHEWMAKPEEVYGCRKNPMTRVWEQFPDPHLEDKVILDKESNVVAIHYERE